MKIYLAGSPGECNKPREKIWNNKLKRKMDTYVLSGGVIGTH